MILLVFLECFPLQFNLTLDESNKKLIDCCCCCTLGSEKELQKRDEKIEHGLIKDRCSCYELKKCNQSYHFMSPKVTVKFRYKYVAKSMSSQHISLSKGIR